jgi:ubiquinone/menaquinone biosynthesis C-methylase UbiE
MTTLTKSKEMADKWSKTSEDSYVRYFEPTTLVVGRFLVNCCKLQFQDKPLKILEAGCGTGHLAREVLQLYGLSCSELVIGDIAPAMLDKAQETFCDCDRQLTIEKADFTQFTYLDESFDRYYSNLCLCYASDPDAVIAESARILKPGGVAGFTVWGRKKGSNCMTIVPDVLHDFGLRKEDPTKRSSFHMGENDEALRQRFLSRGFVKCNVVHFPAVIESMDPALFVEAIIDGAASTKKEVESFSKDYQKRVREEVFKRGAKILSEGRTLALDIAVVVCQK